MCTCASIARRTIHDLGWLFHVGRGTSHKTTQPERGLPDYIVQLPQLQFGYKPTPGTVPSVTDVSRSERVKCHILQHMCLGFDGT